MREIKDYLHLYLGCDVKTSGGRVAKLVSAGISLAIIVYPDGDPIGNAIAPTSLKPILRKISSMTEEEAIELAHVAEINASATDTLLVDKSYNKQWIVWNSTDYADVDDAENNDGVIILDFIHPFGVYKGFENETFPVPDFLVQADVVRYLLSKGFDLFNLIDENLAIDKDTLTK